MAFLQLLAYSSCLMIILNFALGQNLEQISLDEHNQLRQSVASGKIKNQPPGNIPDLEWDPELAKKAQAYANTCPNGHNPDRKFKDGVVGENFASGSNSGSVEMNVKLGVGLWKNELNYYKYPGGFSMRTAHYTQMVWANSKSLGCGLSNCQGGFILICNYFPAGNVMNEIPYERKDVGDPRG